MATVFSSLAEVENRLRLDMNNPTFVEDLTILSGWPTPPVPVIPPPPYVGRSVISVPPTGKNAILLLVDLSRTGLLQIWLSRFRLSAF
jgi:hypothetical protein